MNMKFFKSCYDLAALSTCVQEDGDRTMLSDHIAETRIEFTDNFFAVARYKCICSDYLSPNEYENHEFSIVFIRDENLVESFEFGTNVEGKNVGSLLNPQLSLEEKLAAIKDYSPSRSVKLDNLFRKTKLQEHEQAMVMNKCRKVFASISTEQTQQAARK